MNCCKASELIFPSRGVLGYRECEGADFPAHWVCRPSTKYQHTRLELFKSIRGFGPLLRSAGKTPSLFVLSHRIAVVSPRIISFRMNEICAAGNRSFPRRASRQTGHTGGVVRRDCPTQQEPGSHSRPMRCFCQDRHDPQGGRRDTAAGHSAWDCICAREELFGNAHPRGCSRSIGFSPGRCHGQRSGGGCFS